MMKLFGLFGFTSYVVSSYAFCMCVKIDCKIYLAGRKSNQLTDICYVTNRILLKNEFKAWKVEHEISG